MIKLPQCAGDAETDWKQVIQRIDLEQWENLLGVMIMNVADRKELAALAGALRQRLENSGMKKFEAGVIACSLCCESFEKFSEVWKKFSHGSDNSGDVWKSVEILRKVLDVRGRNSWNHCLALPNALALHGNCPGMIQRSHIGWTSGTQPSHRGIVPVGPLSSNGYVRYRGGSTIQRVFQPTYSPSLGYPYGPTHGGQAVNCRPPFAPLRHPSYQLLTPSVNDKSGMSFASNGPIFRMGHCGQASTSDPPEFCMSNPDQAFIPATSDPPVLHMSNPGQASISANLLRSVNSNPDSNRKTGFLSLLKPPFSKNSPNDSPSSPTSSADEGSVSKRSSPNLNSHHETSLYSEKPFSKSPDLQKPDNEESMPTEGPKEIDLHCRVQQLLTDYCTDIGTDPELRNSVLFKVSSRINYWRNKFSEEH